jgi:hypothetical protein
MKSKRPYTPFWRDLPMRSIAKVMLLVLASLLLNGCLSRHGDSSSSVRHSRNRGLLIAEYTVPAEVRLGEYRPVEVWVEKRLNGNREIIVRLKGPHHGDGNPFRVGIAGLDPQQWEGIWSERNGPPYERWRAPNPLPESLTLVRNGESIEIHLKK